MMGPIFGIATGAVLAYGATRLPNRWFVFPFRFVMFGAGMLLIGNSIFVWLFARGLSTEIVP